LLTHPAASSGLLHKKGQPACGTDRKRHSETLISHIRQLEFLFGKAGLLS
jgi:hypothetical protein